MHTSVKLWVATQDGWVILMNPDKMCSTGEGNGNTHQYSCLEKPWKVQKGKKKNEPPRSESVLLGYATGEEQEMTLYMDITRWSVPVSD